MPEPGRDRVLDGIHRRAVRVAGQVAHDDYLLRASGREATHSPRSSVVMDVDEDGEAVSTPVVIELNRGPLGHRQWGFTCPRCGSTFHRTSTEAATRFTGDHAERCQLSSTA